MEHEWNGIDVSNEISLFEYGLLVSKNEHCSHKDEWYCVYSVRENKFGHGYIRGFDLDEMMKGNDWVNPFDILSFTGLSLDEWLAQNIINKIYDLVQYYGHENIFGTTYFELNRDWVRSSVGI